MSKCMLCSTYDFAQIIWKFNIDRKKSKSVYYRSAELSFCWRSVGLVRLLKRITLFTATCKQRFRMCCSSTSGLGNFRLGIYIYHFQFQPSIDPSLFNSVDTVIWKCRIVLTCTGGNDFNHPKRAILDTKRKMIFKIGWIRSKLPLILLSEKHLTEMTQQGAITICERGSCLFILYLNSYNTNTRMNWIL